MTCQRGSALFLILIAVALFAALSYAVTHSSRAGGNIDREEQKLDQAVSAQCNASVDYAVNKLRLIADCPESDINYDIDDTTPGDKSCHVFEPEGGGAVPCGAYLDDGNCVLETLALGEKCEDADIVYAGELAGTRLYTTAADQGDFTWNNGSGDWTITGVTSTTDGKANTDTLVALSDIGAPYKAANACRGLGSEWYLPAYEELNVLYTNRAAIGGFNDGRYWSSWERNHYNARHQRFTDGGHNMYLGKNENYSVRCVRR